MTQKFTAEEVRARAEYEREFDEDGKTVPMLEAYANTLSKPAGSGRVGDKPAECANGCQPMQVCDFCQDAPVWRAEWAGSAPGRGWYIREGSHLTNAPVVAYLGDNIDKVLVREMVEAHNATVHRDKSLAAQGQGEPVAWQVRIGSSDIWGGCHSKELADFYGRQSGMRYETRPLYTRPAPPASPAPVALDDVVAAVFEDNPRYAIKQALLANAPSAPEGGHIDRARFEKAPCYLCGYNGPGYYQPGTHSCAAKYHATQPKGE